jgi:hypothetical protein
MKPPVLVAFALATVWTLSGCAPQSPEKQIEQSLNSMKQELFDAIHPVGTAKSVRLNSIIENPPYVDIRVTLYWEGPVTTDGYTKVAFRLDSEVERITALEVEDTNGLTNQDIGFAAGAILGGLLQGN